jgi:uncharacterized protein (TIGR03435 family)
MMVMTWKMMLLYGLGPVAFLIPLVCAASPLSMESQAASSSATESVVSQPGAPLPLRFEVASIRQRQSNGNEPSSRQMLPGGRFVATATSARTLIRIAFGIEDKDILGAPSWIDTETFDINGVTANRVEVTTRQQFQQLILSLLEDRFQLKFHREEKEAPVYWLEVDKPGRLGPGLRPSPPESVANMSVNSNDLKATMKATKMSMVDIAAALRRQVNRPVEDQTELKGNFDFQIEWSPEQNPDSLAPSLFTVIKEQLGLKLQPAKGVTEVLVIEQIAQPSAN